MNHCLNKSELNILFYKVSFINSRPLTIEAINDSLGPVGYLKAITPIQLLIMKMNLITPSPGELHSYERK